MLLKPKYPTIEHEKAAKTVVDYFTPISDIEAVILYCSCARGKAGVGSCIDIGVLMLPEILLKKKTQLEKQWDEFQAKETIFQELNKHGRFAEVHLDFFNGDFKPKPREWTSGPDEFELEIGNYLAYSVALLEKGNYYTKLKAQWLPYYDEKLRQTRLAMVQQYCFNNLEHIQLCAKRGLYFQAFKRFYDAFREFLQALFISRRTYPIAYDKWIKEQIEEILKLPRLYPELPKLFEIKNFESLEIVDKARKLEQLYKQYVLEYPQPK